MLGFDHHSDAGAGCGNNFQITGVNLNGQISWTNAFTSGVCTVETATQLNGTNGHTAWMPQQNYFTTNSAGTGGFQSHPAMAFSVCWR